ncbi:hypothetical protein [Streptomyces chilikensis]|uniref:Uncharacterized protein n=1 Tax=Streptomyces chilikensis TaxID=1194079 RepID=A0ABV3ERJ3_9ACTN
MTDRTNERRIEYPDCNAGSGDGDVRIIVPWKDDSGEYTVEEIWHLEDCPEYTLQQILSEDGVRRARERHEWEKEQFPRTLERFRAAVAEAGENGQAPFARALAELVEMQAEDTERGVSLGAFVEVLERHFPGPDGPARPPHG